MGSTAVLVDLVKNQSKSDPNLPYHLPNRKLSSYLPTPLVRIKVLAE